MKNINQVRLEMDNFEKISSVCDVDCTLGMIYDYSCALNKFAVDKINELNASLPKPDAVQEEKPAEPQEE